MTDETRRQYTRTQWHEPFPVIVSFTAYIQIFYSILQISLLLGHYRRSGHNTVPSSWHCKLKLCWSTMPVVFFPQSNRFGVIQRSITNKPPRFTARMGACSLWYQGVCCQGFSRPQMNSERDSKSQAPISLSMLEKYTAWMNWSRAEKNERKKKKCDMCTTFCVNTTTYKTYIYADRQSGHRHRYSHRHWHRHRLRHRWCTLLSSLLFSYHGWFLWECV